MWSRTSLGGGRLARFADCAVSRRQGAEALVLFREKDRLLSARRPRYRDSTMAQDASRWFSRAARLLTIVLALACQIGAGAAAADDAAVSPRDALRAAMVLCLAGNHPAKDGVPAHHRHLADQAVACASHHAGQPAAMPDGAGALPPPSASLAAWAGVPQARGPPAQRAASFYPTGPPTYLI